MLPTPTVGLVEAACRDFDLADQLKEEALRLLWTQFPHNTETSHILLKVLVPSVITLNPAIRDQVKSGHREWPKT